MKTYTECTTYKSGVYPFLPHTLEMKNGTRIHIDHSKSIAYWESIKLKPIAKAKDTAGNIYTIYSDGDFSAVAIPE